MSETKVTLHFQEIRARLKELTLPDDVDVVVGIGRGGTAPATLLAYELDKPLVMLRINYRDDDNTPRHDVPVLLVSPALPPAPCHVLLVDDVSVTGATLRKAQDHLEGYRVTTFVMKGTGDYVLFPEVGACVNWPWNPA